jgi:glycosyltransferase involved in cell wall biosynthesis
MRSPETAQDLTATKPAAKAAFSWEQPPCPPEAATRPGDAGADPAKPVLFIVHPSDWLTDFQPVGDGLVANGFIRELLARGYRLHIAAQHVAMRTPLPANATVYQLASRRDGVIARLVYMYRVRRLLARLRRQERIDLLHQMNPVFAGLSLALVGSRLPLVLGTFVPRWWREIDAGPPTIAERLAEAARTVICFLQQSQADALLITCEAAINRIPLARLAARKLTVVPHGIDTALFAPQPRAPATPPSILFYSHLDRRKGVFVLLEAFRIIAAAMPECRLTLVGRGRHIAEVQRLVAESGLADRISMPGRVERAQAPALFGAHSVYCLPSYGEPYATTVLEAMSCGRPVVVTDAGGLPFMVPRDGGLRVPTGDAPALAQALLTILRSPDLQESMGRANRRYIEENCSWPRVVDQLERVYQRLVAA